MPTLTQPAYAYALCGKAGDNDVLVFVSRLAIVIFVIGAFPSVTLFHIY